MTTNPTITPEDLESISAATDALDNLSDALRGIARLIDNGDRDAAISIIQQYTETAFAHARALEDLRDQVQLRVENRDAGSIANRVQRSLILGHFQPNRDRDTITREACMIAAKQAAGSALKALDKAAAHDPVPHDPVMIDQSETWLFHMLEYLDASGTGAMPEQVLNVTARRRRSFAHHYPQANKMVAGLTGIQGGLQ